MSVAGVNGMAVAAVAGGALLVWSGVKGTSPLKGLSNILTGQAPPTTQTEALQGSGSITDPAAAAGSPGPGPGKGPAPGSSGTPGAAGGSASANQAIARLLAQPYGWSTGAEWAALVSLWNSESGWSNTIWNVTAPCDNGAHAYGIPQACGHGEVKSGLPHGTTCPYPAGNAGNPPACGGSSNASAQISWGLAYIKASYGRPTNVPHGGY